MEKFVSSKSFILNSLRVQLARPLRSYPQDESVLGEIRFAGYRFPYIRSRNMELGIYVNGGAAEGCKVFVFNILAIFMHVLREVFLTVRTIRLAVS